MNERPYSKREEDEFRQFVRERLAEILTQTTKTNGRVSRLEFWRGILTGMGVLIVTIIIPLIAAVITLYRK